jgi:hypothetical protein
MEHPVPLCRPFTAPASRCRRVSYCVALLGSLTLVAACASTPPVSSDPNLLGFLDHPPVTRADVVKVLGPPSAVFERDSVLTYRLRADKRGYSTAPANGSWEGVNYDLVLAFGSDGELREHSLVAIRAPTHP